MGLSLTRKLNIKSDVWNEIEWVLDESLRILVLVQHAFLICQISGVVRYLAFIKRGLLTITSELTFFRIGKCFSQFKLNFPKFSPQKIRFFCPRWLGGATSFGNAPQITERMNGHTGKWTGLFDKVHLQELVRLPTRQRLALGLVTHSDRRKIWNLYGITYTCVIESKFIDESLSKQKFVVLRLAFLFEWDSCTPLSDIAFKPIRECSKIVADLVEKHRGWQHYTQNLRSRSHHRRTGGCFWFFLSGCFPPRGRSVWLALRRALPFPGRTLRCHARALIVSQQRLQYRSQTLWVTFPCETVLVPSHDRASYLPPSLRFSDRFIITSQVLCNYSRSRLNTVPWTCPLFKNNIISAIRRSNYYFHQRKNRRHYRPPAGPNWPGHISPRPQEECTAMYQNGYNTVLLRELEVPRSPTRSDLTLRNNKSKKFIFAIRRQGARTRLFLSTPQKLLRSRRFFFLWHFGPERGIFKNLTKFQWWDHVRAKNWLNVITETCFCEKRCPECKLIGKD